MVVDVKPQRVENYSESGVKRLITRYNNAKAVKDMWLPTFEECYEFALPQRESFYSESIGRRRSDRIFDETAVVGVQEFASRLQSGIVPNYARWADFVAGTEIPKDEQKDVNLELDQVTEYVFEILQNSNFSQEVHETFLDCAVGTGVLLVEEGDAIHPVKFKAIPLPQIVLDAGHDDKVDHVFRNRKIKMKDIIHAYPEAVLSEKMQMDMDKAPDMDCDVLEIVYKNYANTKEDEYKFCVISQMYEHKLFEETYKGLGSNPYIVYRWSKVAGEVYGRGPLQLALPAIKTSNLVIELILDNAQMSISGIYQIDDDGVINVDTINLLPGTVIPKAPNSQGLQPIRSAGSFDVANLILNDMRNNIKRALYNDMLGDPNRTPASATEVAERMADLSRKIGSAFGRLQSEMVQPLLQRVVYILQKQGRIEMPTVNGREVKIRSVSPLAQAQSNQDIVSLNRFLQTVAGSFGPEILNILISSEETALYLAKKFGVPDNLIRDADERQQLVQMAQQMQQMQQQGELPNASTLGG